MKRSPWKQTLRMLTLAGILATLLGACPRILTNSEKVAPTFLELASRDSSGLNSEEKAEQERAKKLVELLKLDPKNMKVAKQYQEGSGLYALTVLELEADEPRYAPKISISRQTGRLARYMNLGAIGHVASEVKQGEKMAHEEACQQVEGFLAAVGVSRALFNPDTERPPFTAKEGQLLGGQWDYAASYRYKDIPVIGGIVLTFNAYDGAIIKFADHQFYPPENITPKIAEDEALKVARGALRNPSPGAEPKVELVFTHPQKTEEGQGRQGWELEFVLAWHVTFTTEDGRWIDVDVDALTGRVIGKMSCA